MLAEFRNRLARAIAPKHSATRRFDAASNARRTSGFGTTHRIGSEVASAAPLVRARARYLATNNPHVANGTANWVASLVGSGITPTSPDPEQIRFFNRWAQVCDFDARTDFWGLQAAIARALVVDGEAFLRLVYVDDALRLQLLPAEQVDESKTCELSNGGFVVNGVEFDSIGRRVAYWIMPVRPTDQFASFRAPVRVDAAEILHIFCPLGAGQVRGISWLAPIAVPAAELDATVDALAVGIKVSALHAGFVIDANGSGAAFDGTQSGTELDVSLEPGTMRVLPPGLDVRFNTPAAATETAAFLRFSLQALAAGFGLPEHLLSGDLTNANYSSLRAGLLPFRARCEQIQYGCLVPQLLNPLWQRVQVAELLAGNVTEISQVEWLPPRWQQVDPAKDVEATVAEIDAGLVSRKQAVAERGWNVEELDAEIAADRQREQALGLSFVTSPTRSLTNAP